jgi:predicted transcriptional regulator
MTSIHPIQHSIQATEQGITLAELLTRHPQIARRTAQRLIQQMVSAGQIRAQGEGRARRYFPVVLDSPIPE